ncbi:SGNH/GDSL hydrolase family protein [Leptospira idonii]|uniref:SGNH/GDSL hydrolase family protein n=1 Tax=Leptospira idonii TaxID=1193500 RepID=A0A4R9M6H8_9LEPT|nr:SGNH/GDSL hydrolase family protein [Leptospira idonii]TGN20288.1 SGNH/GDSL hydrolase family protein [Leptospira idonii]
MSVWNRFSLLFIAALMIINCDTKKDYQKDVTANVLCYTLAACNQSRATTVGMIGDSWTDLLIGYPAVDTLRVQLEKNHGYKITGATLGGKTLSQASDQGLQFQVIEQAGADIHTMILSLGGNDLQANLSAYVGNENSVQAARFADIKFRIKTMILTGNSYKISKYGGQPLKWIIHGYDYPNPYKGAVIPGADEGCSTKFASAGFNLPDVAAFTSQQLDAFNELLRSITSEEPNFYYVDLRRTLGGPPISNAQLMLDCIHPNSLGFQFLGDKLATQISPLTGVSN